MAFPSVLTAEVNCTQTCTGIPARAPLPSYKYVSPDCSFPALAADSLLAFRFNWFSRFLSHLRDPVCHKQPMTALCNERVWRETQAHTFSPGALCSLLERHRDALHASGQERVHPAPLSERPLFFLSCSCLSNAWWMPTASSTPALSTST